MSNQVDKLAEKRIQAFSHGVKKIERIAPKILSQAIEEQLRTPIRC